MAMAMTMTMTLWLLLSISAPRALFRYAPTAAAAALLQEYDKGSHVDFMQLKDNFDFQWGFAENQYYGNRSEVAQSPAHGLRVYKRQAEQATSLLENKDYGPCATPLGETGRCRHIIYCRMPQLKDNVWLLVSQLCIIEQRAIGICCIADTANNRFSPQIADQNNASSSSSSSGGGSSSDTQTTRVVNHAEQRGCGITTRQFTRIVGGRPAEPDEWPWMAAVMRNGLPYVWCGGVLITDRHVLTAAHCLHEHDKTTIYVRLGEYNTRQVNETRARDFRIASFVTHIDYDPLTYEHDIALIRIDRPALYNTYIWPICMPPLNEHWAGQRAVVIGWGTQAFGGPYSDVLMEVSLPIWQQTDCRRAMVERISDNVICAGEPSGGLDSCQGDSGGPLLVQLPNRRWVTVGIVSWGLYCGTPNRPGIYTRVDKYLDWIISNADI